MLSLITKRDVSELWVNMAQAFGLRFTSSFGEQDNGVWYEILRSLTRLELAQGFKSMLKSYKPNERERKEVWPPNAKEFYLFCIDAFKPYSIPSLQKAYSECQDNLSFNWQHWSHPVVFYALLYMANQTIKEDFRHDKIGLFKPYYLMMTQLYLSNRLPKVPSQSRCESLLSSYVNFAEDKRG